MDALWHAGPHNALNDIKTVRLGHATHEAARTGVSVLVFDRPATASVSIIGQAPGTRDMAALDPARTVDTIEALVLSGGSAFGLAAADPVMQTLKEQGRGFAVGTTHVPIVPAAILFDLLNGGTKPRNLPDLYRKLGAEAVSNLDNEQAMGAIGAGTGATTGAGPGGLGMASLEFNGHAPKPLAGRRVAALVAVNAIGSPYVGASDHFRAASFLLEGDLPQHSAEPTGLKDHRPRMKTLVEPGQNTTIGCVITDVPLDKRGCFGLATAGQDGLAAALWPAHTALDGDLIVGASVRPDESSKSPADLIDPATMTVLQAASTACMARAIMRGFASARDGLAAR
ncbi:MAG: P1 family peptidase [Cohaesibacteraceae bacterium]